MSNPNFKSATGQFAVLAGAGSLIYLLVFTLPFLLPIYYNTIPPLDYTKLTGYSAGGLLAYVCGVVGLFVCYYLALKLTYPGKNQINAFLPIFLSSAVFAAILIVAYPLTAIDLFIYGIRTRGWALYGLQPLATPPQDLPADDPWLGLAGEWIDAASPYGPLWELISLSAFTLSGGSYLAHLLLLKVVGAAAYLGCVWLIYQTLRRLQPAWAAAGTVAFAWSPLVLFESVLNAHNDIVMTLFLLAAIWVGARYGPGTGPTNLLMTLLLAASILVKFVTVVAVPFFLLAMAAHHASWGRRLATIAGFGVLLMVLVAAAMWPFWPGWDTWAVPNAGSQAGRSLMALLVLGLRDWVGTNTAFDWSRGLLLGIFGLIFLFFLWRTVVRLRWYTIEQKPNRLIELAVAPTFYTLFWYVLLAAPVFHAWYLLWFVPLASLMLPVRRPLRIAVVFSITALLIIPYFETVRVWFPILLQNHLLGHFIGVPLLVLPPLLTALWPIRPTSKSEV